VITFMRLPEEAQFNFTGRDLIESSFVLLKT